MLREVIIRNLATIEDQVIPFAEGLNVITGETGAGKSVILKALELVLGQKANIELIRSGMDSLEVQALFDLSNLSPSEMGLLPEDWEDQELVIRRTIQSNGKGKIYINGNLATLQQLTAVAPLLLNICSQGQNLNLLDRAYHLEIVDFFADNQNVLTEYQGVFQRWKIVKAALAQSQTTWQQAQLDIENLQIETEELLAIELQENLREQLTQQLEKHRNLSQVENHKVVLDQLFNSESGLFDLLQKLNHAIRELKRVVGAVPSLETMSLDFQNIAREMEREIARVLPDMQEDFDSQQIEERLAELARLQRKYRTDDLGLIEVLNVKQAKLQALLSLDSPEQLAKEFSILDQDLQVLAGRLTSRRTKALPILQQKLTEILGELNLPKAKIEIAVEVHAEPRMEGKESLEFLISLNPGEDCKPLRKVASGGEMSRILLAFKSIFNHSKTGCCFIFDEIDTGISGITARIVGEKLRAIAQNSQVLCITHLPQVASLAEHHLRVEKVVNDRTYTIIQQLNLEQRIDEVARLISGREISDSARISAQELMRH